MITLIGTYNSIIGFGMCGINKIHEVTKNTSADEVARLVERADSKIILIDETVYEKIRDLEFDKIFIQIPDRFKSEAETTEIDALVRDTIGISMKVTE